MQTLKATPEAVYQFFYCSKEPALPHPEVPARDVTNSHGQGNKREPNLERKMENWCSCRPSSITAAAKRAQALAHENGSHYLVLTTRDPRGLTKKQALAIGLMPFSLQHFETALRGHKGRWINRLPYVSDQKLKICSFEDGFPLEMTTSKDGRTHVPGSRYAPVRVPPDLLLRLISHFASKPNRLREFLDNVRVLDNKLKITDPQAYEKYRTDNPSVRCGNR